MSADRESIIHKLPQDDSKQPLKSEVSMTTVVKVTKIVLLCYQLTKISNFFSPTIQHFLYSYIWSKSEVSMTTVAKVTKFVLLCYQLTKISKKLAQPHSISSMTISGLNLKLGMKEAIRA